MPRKKKLKKTGASGLFDRSVVVKGGSYYTNIPMGWAKAKGITVDTIVKIVTYETHLEVFLLEDYK